MTWMVKFRTILIGGLPALLALGLGCQAASAATPVVVKNDGPTQVQFGFDGGQSKAILPRGSAQFSLEAGEHSSQCRFEGVYDGCNIEERFTLGTTKGLNIALRPVLTLQHAVALAQQGMLTAQTIRDMTWATKILDLPGPESDCADYSAGKLATVSTRVRSGMAIRDMTLANQTLCGERKTVIQAVVNGAPLYFEPRFVTFRDGAGRPVSVRQ
ncbi:MAG TPA: hypothetical protein VK479_07020 [Micropepsaceae bacterium]|nr:hypothetical protein [Micropepsaceae bacterium]